MANPFSPAFDHVFLKSCFKHVLYWESITLNKIKEVEKYVAYRIHIYLAISHQRHVLCIPVGDISCHLTGHLQTCYQGLPPHKDFKDAPYMHYDIRRTVML